MKFQRVTRVVLLGVVVILGACKQEVETSPAIGPTRVYTVGDPSVTMPPYTPPTPLPSLTSLNILFFGRVCDDRDGSFSCEPEEGVARPFDLYISLGAQEERLSITPNEEGYWQFKPLVMSAPEPVQLDYSLIVDTGDDYCGYSYMPPADFTAAEIYIEIRLAGCVVPTPCTAGEWGCMWHPTITPSP